VEVANRSARARPAAHKPVHRECTVHSAECAPCGRAARTCDRRGAASSNEHQRAAPNGCLSVSVQRGPQKRPAHSLEWAAANWCPSAVLVATWPPICFTCVALLAASSFSSSHLGASAAGSPCFPPGASSSSCSMTTRPKVVNLRPPSCGLVASSGARSPRSAQLGQTSGKLAGPQDCPLSLNRACFRALPSIATSAKGQRLALCFDWTRVTCGRATLSVWRHAAKSARPPTVNRNHWRLKPQWPARNLKAQPREPHTAAK